MGMLSRSLILPRSHLWRCTWASQCFSTVKQSFRASSTHFQSKRYISATSMICNENGHEKQDTIPQQEDQTADSPGESSNQKTAETTEEVKKTPEEIKAERKARKEKKKKNKQSKKVIEREKKKKKKKKKKK